MSIEVLIYASIFIAGILLFFLLVSDKKQVRVQSVTREKRPEAGPKPPPEMKVTEIFDYGAVKILHENGMYTVNENGKVMTFKSWRYLPEKYQKMVKQVDSGTIAKSTSGYFLDNINGVYYLTMPNGKKKTYRSLDEIPEKIRKIVC